MTLAVGPGQERERLRGALDGYAAEQIAAMLERHSPGAGAARRKAERVEQLTELLGDPEFARRAVAGLPPLGRRLLAVVRRYGRTSLAALLLAGAEQPDGDEPARHVLEELLAGGLLLLESAPRAAAGTAIVDLADRASPLRWVWAPQTVLDALPPEELDRSRLMVARRAPERVEAGSFADFRRDVYLVIRFLKGSGLRLTRTGQPHRTDQRKLLAALRPGQAPAGRRAVGVEVDGRLAFLLQLLMQTGLARDAGAVLRAAESADAFLDAPELLAAKQLYDAWLRLDWNEFARLAHVSIERSPYAVPSDAPTRERLAGARRAIGDLLAGLAGATGGAGDGAEVGGDWASVQGLVDTLRRTDPEFLVTRASETPAGLNNGPGHYDAYYQNWHQHEQAFYRGIERADARGRERRLRKDRDWNEVEGAYVAQLLREPLRWLGLVDVGFDPGGEGPVAVRLTELGRRLFSRAPADAARRSRPVLVVQPNFEVVVLDALSNLDLLARLDAFAEAQGLDRAAIYRLTRQALVRGLAAGWTEEAIVATLEGGAGAPLPQNVRRSLRGWATDYERIRLHRGAALLEVGEPAELDALLADPATAACVERRLAPTVALLRDSEPGTVAPLAARYGPRLSAIDYVVDRPRVLDVRSPGELVVAADADEPYLHYRLARFADRQDGAAAREGAPGDGGAGPVGAPGATYAISPASLARARASGYTIDDVLSFLGFKARTGLAADDVLTLRGWAGYYVPFRHARARVVEAPPTASWGDLSRVRALRPLIARVLSARLALIREEDWPRFEAALAARGIALGADRLALPDDQQRADQEAPARAGGAQRPPRVGARARAGRPRLRRLAGRALNDFVEEALDREAPLVIEYRRANERRATLRTIEPRELEVRGGVYYLRAFCRLRQEERDFRLSNILGVALADE